MSSTASAAGPPPGSLLGDPVIRRAVLATFTGTLGAGIAPIGLVLLCRAAGLSYSEVGVVLAGEAAGLLLGGPWRGRAVDRRGPRIAISGFAAAHSVLLLGLLATVQGHAPVAVSAAMACAASATFPPFTAVLRERWAVLLPDPAQRHRGFTAQAILQEAVFVAGPVVATVCAGLIGPPAIIPAMLVLTAAGAIGVVRDAPRGRHIQAGDADRHWLGALVSPGVRVVVLAHVPLGLALGAIELTAVAIAESSGERPLAGLLVTLFSLGSAAGGMVWARRPHRDPARAFRALAAAFLALQLPLLLASGFGIALPLYTLAGLAFAPLVATVYALLDTVARPGTTAEATTWLTTAMGLGAIVGSAAAGVLVDGGTPTHGFLLPILGAALAFATAAGGARWLVAEPAASQRPAQPS